MNNDRTAQTIILYTRVLELVQTRFRYGYYPPTYNLDTTRLCLSTSLKVSNNPGTIHLTNQIKPFSFKDNIKIKQQWWVWVFYAIISIPPQTYHWKKQSFIFYGIEQQDQSTIKIFMLWCKQAIVEQLTFALYSVDMLR